MNPSCFSGRSYKLKSKRRQNPLVLIGVYIMLLAATACLRPCAAQTKDTSNIRCFARSNETELLPGVYHSAFYFTGKGSNKPDYQLVVNSSAYLGTYFNYKWISLKFSIAMPGTQLDRDVRFRYVSLGFHFYPGSFVFHPYYDSYNGLLVGFNRTRDSFGVFRDIQFKDAGLETIYYGNARSFSSRAANRFSEQILHSSGSWFLTLMPVWQRIRWRRPSPGLVPDSSTFALLSSSPNWFSLICGAGYQHAFSFSAGKWMISPAISGALGALRERSLHPGGAQVVWRIYGWANAGYCGDRIYAYLHAEWTRIHSNLLVKNMKQESHDFSITLGYRFKSLNHRILGIL